MSVTRFARESQQVLPEHVKGGKKDRGKCKSGQQPGPASVNQRVMKCIGKDGILTPETGEARKAGESKRGEQIAHCGGRHLPEQTAVSAHRLLVMHRVDNRARSEEEAGLEKSMRCQMKQPGHPAADAEGKYHIAQLAHRGVGQNAFDIVLHESDCCGKKSCKPADAGDHRQCRLVKEREHPADEVYPRSNHRCGMYERAHRSRAFHGVGKPHVQRKLRTLAHGAEKEAQSGPGAQAATQDALLNCGKNIRVLQRADLLVADEQSDEHAKIADPRGDKRFNGSIGSGLLLVPVSDQEVRAEADKLPEHKQVEQIVRQNESKHGGAEKKKRAVVSAVADVVMHVAERKEIDQEAYTGDHNKHYRSQGIDHDSAGQR